MFGNFVNRAVVLTHKYFGGAVPENKKPEAIDAQTLAELKPCREALEKYIETFHFREALKEAMNMARIGNKYISDMEPWKVAKEDMDRTASILYTCLQICADLAIAFEPFTPFSAQKLRDILRVGVNAGWDHRAGEGTPTVNFYKADEGKAVHTRAASSPAPTGDLTLDWSMLGASELLPAGHQLGEAVLLFRKIEDEEVNAQIVEVTRQSLPQWRQERLQRRVHSQKSCRSRCCSMASSCSFRFIERANLRLRERGSVIIRISF